MNEIGAKMSDVANLISQIRLFCFRADGKFQLQKPDHCLNFQIKRSGDHCVEFYLVVLQKQIQDSSVYI